jgi:hypothetical protein
MTEKLPEYTRIDTLNDREIARKHENKQDDLMNLHRGMKNLSG